MNSLNTRRTFGSAGLQAVHELVELARELNARRPPDHRERISRAVASVAEYFRDGVEDELPSDQASPLPAQVTAFGAAAYYLTDGFDLPFRPKRRGEPKYWRGQRIDDD